MLDLTSFCEGALRHDVAGGFSPSVSQTISTTTQLQQAGARGRMHRSDPPSSANTADLQELAVFRRDVLTQRSRVPAPLARLIALSQPTGLESGPAPTLQTASAVNVNGIASKSVQSLREAERDRMVALIPRQVMGAPRPPTLRIDDDNDAVATPDSPTATAAATAALGRHFAVRVRKQYEANRERLTFSGEGDAHASEFTTLLESRHHSSGDPLWQTIVRKPYVSR
jgi:hypothetical protein